MKKATCPDGFIIVLLKHPGTHIPYITLQIIKMGNNAITYFMSLVQFISKPNQDNMRREDHRGISCKNHAKIAILAKKISKIIVIKKQHISN